jgi:circadian clock protein KaiB
MGEIRLKLFVAGRTPRSERAVANLEQIGDEHLAGRYVMEVVDVLKDPEAAERYRILTTPTLIRELPEPVVRVTGDLSHSSKVLHALGLVPSPSTEIYPRETGR